MQNQQHFMTRFATETHRSDALRAFPLGLLVGLMLFAVGAVSVWNIYAEYQAMLEKEYHLLEIRARQREARIGGTLRSIDLLLKNLIDDLIGNQRLTQAEQNALLRKHMRMMPELRNLLVIDAAGRIHAEARELLAASSAVS